MTGGNKDDDRSDFVKNMEDMDWPPEKKLDVYHGFHEYNVKAKQMESRLKKLVKGFLDALKKSKGPLTKQGQYINYHEHHALEAGVFLMASAWISSEAGSPQMGGIFAYTYFLVGMKVFKDEAKECGGHASACVKLVSELRRNLHYYIFGGFLSTVVFYWLGFAAPELMFSGEIVAMILGS